MNDSGTILRREEKKEEREKEGRMRKILRIVWKLVRLFWPFPGSEIEAKGDLGEADTIFAQSFGYEEISSRILPSRILPGPSNEVMARLIWEIFKKYGHPMILQWEVADALPKEANVEELVKSEKLFLIRKHREWDEKHDRWKYLDSQEVARQALVVIKQYGWIKLILVAHPWHMWRKIEIFKKLGIEIVIPPHLNSIPFCKCKRPGQWWTINWLLWSIREASTRFYYLVKRWI